MATSLEMLKDIEKSLHVEGEGLAAIAEQINFTDILADFENYDLFIEDRGRRLNSKKLIKKITNGHNIVYGINQSDELKNIFYYSHVAACCELFSGWELPVNALNRQNMISLVNQSLSQLKDASKEKLYELQSRIQRTDVIRSMQILRMMGLLSSKSSAQRQFSFAAGNANRELDGVHMSPIISRRSNILKRSEDVIVFGKRVNQPENIVLVDNDPAFKELYLSLNQSQPERVLAFNENADQAIKKLSTLINEKRWKPCNLVAGIRIDHEIIPDVADFFKQFLPVLDLVSDFIISVGAGHNLQEFEGRIQLMSALFEYLTKKGLQPVKIILHANGTSKQQRDAPLFGCGPTTTYEILYCKIKKKKLL